MATMSNLSKAEYLKRYLSADSSEVPKKKKRRKKPLANIPRVRIVDDDIDLKALVPDPANGPTNLEELDEAPTVADFIDERPEHVKQLEEFRQSDRWKIMNQDRDTDTLGRPRRRHDSDSDSSGKNFMYNSPKRKRHDSDSDQSPPRGKRNDSDSDQSPPRGKRHDSGSDQSPPRGKRHDSDSDQSPPRGKRLDSDSDQSPPRGKQHGSVSDQSPPRGKRHDSDSDQSPPRGKRHNSDSDQSPPRSRKRLDSDSDQSSRRKNETRNSKSSSRTGGDKNSKRSRWAPEDENDDEKMKETLSGKKAGLSSAKDMKRELDEVRRREDVAFSKIDDKVLGKNAKTVVRDKRSKQQKLDEAKMAAKKLEMEKKYEEWGKGIKQQEAKNLILEDHLHEMSKPLARLEGDEDLESMLKEKERAGDPMAAFMKKKKNKDSQGKKKAYPVYKGPQPPPNRYGIRPGYRWDGVDRSNGFEKKIYAQVASKKAVQEEAYKWSIEDM